MRFGIKGDASDDWNYGIRLETSTNPRSPRATFGSNGTSGNVTPSDKSGSGINVGQVYLGWHPTSWFEATAGRMAMPLYTTPMVWDSDINPEGAFEKFKVSSGNLDLFADFGQFDYQDPSSSANFPSTDVFVLAWQAGGSLKFDNDKSFKVAPVFYNYTGMGSGNGLNAPFVGQGNNIGSNVGVPGGSSVILYNEQGLNDLLVLEVPFELNYQFTNSTFGALNARAFGDFGYNFAGATRAHEAYFANRAAFPGLHGPEGDQVKSYQLGIGIGSAQSKVGEGYGPTAGVVYGSPFKRNSWEARMNWQHIEQYSLDPNLIDSDFFEGRGNLEGVFTAVSYSITDAITGTLRFGYANRIDNKLGTGGNNLNIPSIKAIKNYTLFQMDLSWRL